MRIHNPSHPGEIIREFCVEVLELSYKWSEVIGSEQEILFSLFFFEMLMTSLINLKNAPVVLFKLKVFHKNIMVSC